MSALTRVLRELAQEGVEVAAATRRFLSERFADAADTPANVERVRRVLQRAEPQLPSQGANPFAVPVARAQRAAQRPLAARPQRPLAVQPEAAPALPPPAEPLPEYAAKPHVTIEAAARDPYNTPQGFGNRVNEVEPGAWDRVVGHPDFHALGGHATVETHFPDIWAQIAGGPEDIVQIKGKQNRAPNDEYLPLVQDFVRQGTWSNVGDLGNTGLVRLPDGRYITQQQAEEGVAAIPETTVPMRAYGSSEMVPTRRVYDPTGLDRLDPEEWTGIAQHFEGYAVGGRVDPQRCFSRHPLSAKR